MTWVLQRQLTNLHYMFCNVNVSLGQVLENIVNSKVLRVSIQFPDPHFKRSHQKRRLVTDTLVQTLGAYLPSESEILVQTDVEQVYSSVVETFQNNGFVRKQWQNDTHPWHIPTEREISCRNHGRPIYRAIFSKNTVPSKNKVS